MLEDLFNPGSVAIVGASSNQMKIGYAVLKNLVESGYRGKIYPVNPRSGDILGIPAKGSLDQIGEQIDLVVVSLPAASVIQEIEACVKLQVPYVVIIPGGFSETGSEGRELEKRIGKIISGTRTRVIGPNTVGVYFPHSRVNMALTPPDRVSFPPAGEIAFISQSGALGLLTMDSISEYGIGISAFINLGNRLDLEETELLQYLSTDDRTRSIAVYVESLRDGREFYRTLKEVNAIKPVVVLKSGRSSASAKAASLHTGAMASDDRIVNGMLRQAGAIRAYNEIELLDYARTLAHGMPFTGTGVAILTTAGGVGVITADYVSSEARGIGMRLAKLSETTKDRIRKEIVSFGSVENPIDLTADGSVASYDSVLGILSEDEAVDAIITYALPQTPKMDTGIVDIISKHSRTKPIVVGVIGSKLGKKLLIEFEKMKIPAFPSIERTVKAVKVLHDYGCYRRR